MIDLTRAVAVPQVYAGDNYGFAISGLMRIAGILAGAGCLITVLADPEFIHAPAAQRVLEAAPSIKTIAARDETVVPSALAALHPAACVIWNGIHVPHIAGACRDHGTRPIFAEAGWFHRDTSAFLDSWGVMVGSSLSQFRPGPGLSDADRRSRLASIARVEERTRLYDADYLLLLLDYGNGWAYFDPRHRKPLVIIEQLRERFPGVTLAVRAHPTDRERLPKSLPKGVIDAGQGSLLDWAAFCTAAIGASSKAAFFPALYDNPMILIGGSVASGPLPHPAFLQRNRIAAIAEADLLDHSRCEQARAFVYEAVFHRHVSFDHASPGALAENRILAPLLS